MGIGGKELRQQSIMETPWIVESCLSFCQPNLKTGIDMTWISRPRPQRKLSSIHCCLLPSQETTGMLQTQLREAQRELEQAAQQHRDDLAALQEEGSSLLQEKIELQKQVLAPLSQPHSPSPA